MTTPMTPLELLQRVPSALLVVLGSIAYGLLLQGLVRKIFARVQGRIGPPLVQPFIDLFKVMFLRTAIQHGVMNVLGPVFRAVGGVGLVLLVPLVVGSPALSGFSFSGDLLLVLYFVFFGSLGMALGASDAGHPHSPIAVSRGLSQMTAYELPFALAVIALAAGAESFSISDIVEAQRGGLPHWHLVTQPFAAIAAFVAFLGMTMYSPFDIVGAPQEIPGGPPIEYNATFQSLLMTGRATFGVAKLVLFMDLFLGGATTLLEALVKTFAIYLWAVFIGAVFPRFRTEQSIRFFLKWPTLSGLVAVAVAAYAS